MAKRKIKRITRKPRKKRKVFKRVVIFLIVFGLLYCGLQAYRIGDSLLASLNAVERTELGDTDDDLMINDGVSEALADTDITNIALFGVDARPGETSSRSDTILILSINNETGDITLTSILRDTYLKIPGHYYTRINTAYAIGGAELAVQTINRNFDMNIKDYITVDFSAIADIVDAMGGLEITVTEDELSQMNYFIDENNKLLDGDSPHVSAGTQVCDGNQVLSYVRIRKLGNGDFDRTARQRIVVTAILEKIKSDFSVDMILSMAESVSDDVTTSLTNKEIFSLAYTFARSDSDPVLASLTSETYLKSATIDGAMILLPYTLADACTDLHAIIYGDSDYTPSDTVQELSKELYNETKNEKIYTISTGTTLDTD